MGASGLFIPPALPVQRGLVVTDTAGDAVWVFPTPFPVVPRVTVSLGPSADTAMVEGRITALSATQVTVNVRRAPSVQVVGISVLQVPQAAIGVPVQLVAIAP